MNGKIAVTNNSLSELQNYSWSDSNNKKHRFTSIIMLTYNKLEYTKLCIESIRKFTKKGCYEIVVVDNASSDETAAWLSQQDDLVVILNKVNRGFPAGCNQGIEASKGESILLLNNDVIVSADWLYNLNETLWSDEQIGAVGGSSNSISYLQAIGVDYSSITAMLDFAKEFNCKKKKKTEYRVKLVGFCMLIKRDILEEIGLLDELFTPGNYEDDDLSYRIALAGKKLIFCQNAFIHHFGSVSFEHGSVAYNKLMNVNRAKFKKKWKFDANYSSNIRLDLIKMIEEKDENKKINILEVGCGCGGTLLYLKSKYKNANIYGIEIDENSGQIASSFFETIIGNAEMISLPFKDRYFDYIILGDVIEHLIEPELVLDKLYIHLKEGGSILTSIPNIMHISVVEELLKGNFSYADAGVLDRTHMRFFTLTEIAKMLNRAEYYIAKVTSNTVDTTDSQKELIEILSGRFGKDLKHQYDAYQYLLEVKALKMAIDIELKYSLMQLDNDIDIAENIEKICDCYLKNPYKFSRQLDVIIKENIINKGELYNKIAVGLYTRNELETAADFFLKSYKLNRNDADTVYNLCFIKAQLFEFAEGYEILSRFEEENELSDEFSELKNIIESNLN